MNYLHFCKTCNIHICILSVAFQQVLCPLFALLLLLLRHSVEHAEEQPWCSNASKQKTSELRLLLSVCLYSRGFCSAFDLLRSISQQQQQFCTSWCGGKWQGLTMSCEWSLSATVKHSLGRPSLRRLFPKCNKASSVPSSSPLPPSSSLAGWLAGWLHLRFTQSDSSGEKYTHKETTTNLSSSSSSSSSSAWVSS